MGEKLKIRKNGQWELTKAKSDFPRQQWKKLTDSMPDDFTQNATDQSAKDNEPHTPEHWGPKINIDPKDVVHHSSIPSEDWNKGMDSEDLDYDYVRNHDGRVYQQLFGDNDFSHLHGKYLPTNVHESDPTDSDGSLTDAQTMGNVFKKPITLH